jgi:hypothetical protein
VEAVIDEDDNATVAAEQLPDAFRQVPIYGYTSKRLATGAVG